MSGVAMTSVITSPGITQVGGWVARSVYSLSGVAITSLIKLAGVTHVGGWLLE